MFLISLRARIDGPECGAQVLCIEQTHIDVAHILRMCSAGRICCVPTYSVNSALFFAVR